eukprot:CAMPEP_0198139942 /NCGR_PEP_ID=MMETSP1443-20131203/3181_1 /TAXON_ID=186043 /ORGANISM="Entomoneis sp., Strain CCMP2396" /LENGTH=240 /DNA_ID=CAMNT_0043802221 /DNA_START=14 /DNA_END=736 /DNA_ORIENTATION=+
MTTLRVVAILLLLIKGSLCWQLISPESNTAPTKRLLQKPSKGLVSRRNFVITVPTSIIAWQFCAFSNINAAFARAPGSKDLSEALGQIQGAVEDLRKLRDDWDSYATIDAEGRAGSTDAARRILGGIAPQAGTAAIEVAKSRPLYRIDGAFLSIRQAAINDDAPEVAWPSDLDLAQFEELAERVLFAVQKADGDFYSVLFAQKGTRQISGIFSEAKGQVNQGISDFEEVLRLLKDAGAPL